jgi:two-component system, NarL family, invasion response regulator UvrY
MESQTIKIAIANDHALLRSALASVINKTGNFSVVIEAANGNELMAKMQQGILPDLILLDMSMALFDGYKTVQLLQIEYPEIHVIMLMRNHTEHAMIRLLQAGVKGFLTKETDISELRSAVNSVMNSGYYHTNHTTGKLINLFRKGQEHSTLLSSIPSDREYRFLGLVCSERTYKEIAKEMGISPRAVDNIRDTLFAKLEVKSRVGLVLYAFRHGIQTA